MNSSQCNTEEYAVIQSLPKVHRGVVFTEVRRGTLLAVIKVAPLLHKGNISYAKARYDAHGQTA